MEALRASYGDASSESDADSSPPTTISADFHLRNPFCPPPPPPLSLLTPPNSVVMEGALESLQIGKASRIRSFPHVEGNFALHVYIPVYIPSPPKKDIALVLKRVASLVPGLHIVDADVPLNILCKDDQKLESVALGREFHISLGRTVPIRVHQIDSVVSMLRQKLQIQKRYWIDFNKWEVFVNDERTRTFLSIDVTAGGLAEIKRQIQAVNAVYKLHNLPEFYEDPHPHISLAWALGDISNLLKRVVEEDIRRNVAVGGSSQKSVFISKFSGIKCKIGNRSYKICKFLEE